MNDPIQNLNEPRDVYLGMGQAQLVQPNERVICFLGSCVAVSLYSPIRAVGAISHVVLGHAEGRNGSEAKYADQAVSYMCDLLKQQGCELQELEAAMSGGASLLKQGGPFQVGRSNATILETELAKQGIPLVQRDIGGVRSRRTVFHGATGSHQTVFGEAKAGIAPATGYSSMATE